MYTHARSRTPPACRCCHLLAELLLQLGSAQRHMPLAAPVPSPARATARTCCHAPSQSGQPHMLGRRRWGQVRACTCGVPGPELQVASAPRQLGALIVGADAGVDYFCLVMGMCGSSIRCTKEAWSKSCGAHGWLHGHTAASAGSTCRAWGALPAGHAYAHSTLARGAAPSSAGRAHALCGATSV